MTALSAALGRPNAAKALFPGVLACAVVAAAATFLSEHYGAPQMLFALLLGLAVNSMPGRHVPSAERKFIAMPSSSANSNTGAL